MDKYEIRCLTWNEGWDDSTRIHGYGQREVAITWAQERHPINSTVTIEVRRSSDQSVTTWNVRTRLAPRAEVSEASP